MKKALSEQNFEQVRIAQGMLEVTTSMRMAEESKQKEIVDMYIPKCTIQMYKCRCRLYRIIFLILSNLIIDFNCFATKNNNASIHS